MRALVINRLNLIFIVGFYFCFCFFSFFLAAAASLCRSSIYFENKKKKKMNPAQVLFILWKFIYTSRRCAFSWLRQIIPEAMSELKGSTGALANTAACAPSLPRRRRRTRKKGESCTFSFAGGRKQRRGPLTCAKSITAAENLWKWKSDCVCVRVFWI